MNDPLMSVMQIKIEALERQFSKLAEENERVRNLLTEFDQRHDTDVARAEAAEAKLAKAVKLMELSVELATWNTTLLDDVILFITELKESEA